MMNFQGEIMNIFHQPAMNQKIFDMGFNTETISLYLLCCGLQDSGSQITSATIRQRWNSSERSLADAMKLLTHRNILVEEIASPQDQAIYRLTDVHGWR
jgi:hypothetical protein